MVSQNAPYVNKQIRIFKNGGQEFACSWWFHAPLVAYVYVGRSLGLLIIYIFLYCLSGYIMSKNIFCNLNKQKSHDVQRKYISGELSLVKKKKKTWKQPMLIYIWFAWIEKMWCVCIFVYMCVCNITQPLKKAMAFCHLQQCG